MNSYIILLIIALYFGLLLFIAWLTGRGNSNNNEAFFLGNRKSPWYIVSIGMAGLPCPVSHLFPFQEWSGAST